VTVAYDGGGRMKMVTSIHSQAGAGVFIGGGLFRVAL
jgi:hypothetical protein